ncbi:MAG: hypothetical protein BGN96_07850 [Bacteroidales bacterium 45-6]|nr:MAG: hypothetical protein BGN96_07850 [Bacteroidales bacterium 45-6]
MKTKFLLTIIAVATAFIFAGCEKNNDVALAGITLSKTSVTLKPETTETLTCTFFPENATNKAVTWSSSDPNIASVDNNGVITAKSVGSAKITATSTQDASLKTTCDVTVAWTQLNNVSGEVSGLWEKNTIVNVSGHISVPKGKTLTIEEGVQVIFDDNGVGASHTKIEFLVAGSLFCKGTATNPVLFSVATSKRTADNTFAGLWGGIVATADCPALLFDHVVIEYTGAPVVADSPSAIAGIYTAGGDATPHITTSNVNGNYVVTNSELRYGASDACYFMGGNIIVANNLFHAIGKTGGEAVNIKAGCKADIAFNVIYSPNTNGLKLSSSGQNDATGRYQAQVKAYNNTIINAGWRRDGIKGGSAYIEKAALVAVYNNLIVNSKFKAMTPSWGTVSITAGCDTKSIIDYNFYASGSQQSTLPQDVTAGTTTAYLGYTLSNKNIYPLYVDTHSKVSASAGDTASDPKFVSYPLNSDPLTSYTFNKGWDLHVQAGSPVLAGAYNGTDAVAAPFYASTGITVNGITYKTPAPVARFGAFGSN